MDWETGEATVRVRPLLARRDDYLEIARRLGVSIYIRTVQDLLSALVQTS
jgi:hypothetical protein